MIEKSFSPEQIITGWLLISSGLIFFVGGMLFTGRVIWRWPVGKTHHYLLWERGFVIAALLVAVLGLALLDRMLEAAGDWILAPSGMAIILVGAAVIVVTETIFLSRGEWVFAAVVTFVVLAFLGQAMIGASLLSTHLLPRWVGWGIILWNLGWLVVLPIARPKEMYYPWLHYVAPVLIGVELLLVR